MADLRSFRSEGYNTGNVIGNTAYQKARNSGLTSLQINRLAQEQGVSFGGAARVSLRNDLAARSQSDLADVNAGWQSQIDSISSGFNSQISDLTNRLQTQSDSFASAQADWTRQMSEQQALFTQQQNQLVNLQNSRVPIAENTAAETTATTPGTTKKKAGDLSSLSIVSGLGTQDNPLAGLQLA